MKNSHNFIFKAVFTVTFFTVIDRILGFLFKIYLSREMGAASMGIYQVALSIFFLLLTVTTSGIPLIVSKLTAKYEANRNHVKSHKTATAALIVSVSSAVIVCAATLLLRAPLGKLMASPESMVILTLMLPGVLFSGVYSAFRGNLWGKQKYTVMSVIEVIEQVTRILLTVILFCMGFNKLKVTALSLSLSCAVTAVCCCACYFCHKGKIASPKGEIVPLIASSAPITFVRAGNSIVNSVIALVVPAILVGMGYSNERAMYIFGSSIGMALPLLYVPITVVGSLAYVMIPTLSKAYSGGDINSARRQVETAIKFSIMVAALFIPAFWALGEPVGKFVYDNADSGKFLSAAAWLLIPVSVENITSSMMNSLDLEKRGFVNYLIGSAALFAIIGAFCKNFTINILAIGLGVSLTLSSILDILCIRKRTGCSLNFVTPLIISCLLTFPAKFLTSTVYNLLGYAPMLLNLAVSGIVSCAFMFVTMLVFGIIDLGIVFGKRNPKKRLKSIAKSTN